MPLRLIEGQSAPGDPITVDLASDDLASAQDFYGPLFDWEFEDVAEHLWATKGRRLAAGFGVMEALDLARSRWWLCLAAPDLDEMTERAVSLGGDVSGRTDLGGLGHAAVLEDPAGASAVLWQPRKLWSPVAWVPPTVGSSGPSSSPTTRAAWPPSTKACSMSPPCPYETAERVVDRPAP